jgi:hypothetical protein
MKLLTKEIIKRSAEVGRQEEVKDPIVIAKFFDPTGGATWWSTEYDPEDKIFFGFVNLGDRDCAEWGSFSLDELEHAKDGKRGLWALPIERDRHCGEKPISEFAPYAIIKN